MKRRGPLGRRAVLRIIAATGVSLGLGGGLLRELVRRGRLNHVRRTEARLGTLVTLACLHPDGERARNAVNAGFAEIARLEKVLSRHDPTAEVARLNRGGVLSAPDPALLEVLEAARGYSESSGGAFDVTIAPLVDLFADRFGATGVAPSTAEVAAARALVDYRALEWNRGEVRLGRPGMAISLDGIAKGYIVDKTVEALTEAGFRDVLVEAGGDVGSAGTGPDGLGWRVGVEVPSGAVLALTEARLHGESLATSGDSQRAYTEDRSAHHIVDPRTGHSPTELQAVSVRAGSALAADAISTAVMVLGAGEGLALLDGSPGTEGLLTAKDGLTRHSAGWHSAPYPALS